MTDQWRRGFRFLADRGVPPRYVWLSRQVVASASAALLVVAVALAAFLVATVLLPDPLQFSGPNWVRYPYVYAATFAVGYVVLAITIGQLLAHARSQQHSGRACQCDSNWTADGVVRRL